METDGGGERGGGGDGGVSVEAEKKNSPEAEPKVKRKMKTPSQLEILEKTYAVEAYPSEALRAELSIKLGLTDRQLQMWFCHRRLKDRKVPPEKKLKKSALSSTAAASPSGIAHRIVVKNADVAPGRSAGPGLDLYGNTNVQHQQQTRVAHKVGTAVPRISMESLPAKRFYEPPLAVSEQRAIKFVEAQLGEPLREDGPILGMEFDPLPPGSFGAPIVTCEQQKAAWRSYDPQLYERTDAKPIKGASGAVHEYQFLPEKPPARHDDYDRAMPPHFYGLPNPISNVRSAIHSHEQVSSEYLQTQLPDLHILPQQSTQKVHLSLAPREVDNQPPLDSVVNASIDTRLLVHPVTRLADKSITPDRRIVLDHERLERKRKAEEARIAKEVEAHEKRMRKELEKQDIIRRKKEEQMRKEMERQDRERRREEERLLREKQREEERYLKEQRREMERREKFRQKEYIRAEKMRLKEERRREKEAARLKAANNRAAARKIAKEPTELVEDERLELMELATLSKGLPSILALDSETLENLDLFKDKLPEFPPELVLLKRPFRVQPWINSEENVGNLLMVWRFLIAFADVLGLWPFTLDEFIEALHDCDSRLLGEIHIAILRCIMKDIEDVARTPANTMGANQSSAFNPLGGHPHAVEGAHAWGFDFLNWQRLLTPLTWPEVLRQFALSAGFGPKLKKRITNPAHAPDDNECDDGAAAISNLRSGLAAENAVTIMQERGLSNSRRSRHRLTPGTVKYAAFHILSLEGSKGLTILEVADKIQRSGLRDLTTSKTPEASISAALSRDTKLFERTAPSTYCVRSPYRKDPSNAEEILSSARDRVLACQNGIVEEEAEKEDLARDQESESDGPDDPDVDDLDAAVPKTNEAASHYGENSINALGSLKSGLPFNRSADEIKSRGENSGVDFEIAGHDFGEQWIQGLSEMEYSDLSIEERLGALVALVGIANEGNAIRIALEERLEAANALKKQMWAEAQLDKRRFKDELSFKFQHQSSVEHRKSQLASVYMKNESSSLNPAFQFADLNDQQNEENYCESKITEKRPLVHNSFVVSDNMLLQQTAEKSRSQIKALIGYRAEEIYVHRSLPLGQDRRRNRYWQFMTSSSRNDPGSGKIYVELCNRVWRIIDSEEGFNALLTSLDVRGIREYHLHSMLQNIGASFKKSASINLLRSNTGVHSGEGFKKEFPDIKHKLENNGTEENKVIERYKDFEWLWKECFNISGALKYGTFRREKLLEICKSCHGLFSWEDSHCPYCHRTHKTSELHFSFAEHIRQCQKNISEGTKGILLDLSLPPRVRLLKVQLASIEASIPSDAFGTVWSDEYRECWGRKLYEASTAEDLLQSLTLLEDGIKREFLSANYETTSEILTSSGAAGNCVKTLFMPKEVAVLPWIPRTTPAVALRLMELDLSIYYTLDQKAAHEKEKESGHITKFPSMYPASENSMGNPSQTGFPQQDNGWPNPINGHTTVKRGRGRPRGPSLTACAAKAQKKPIINPQVGPSNSTPTKGNNKFPSLLPKKGRRSTIGRQKSSSINESGTRGKIVSEDTTALRQEDWNMAEDNGAENSASSSGRSEFDKSNASGSADEYDDDVSAAGFSRHEPYNESVDYEVDRENDDVDGDFKYEDNYNYYDQGYVNSDYNKEQIQSSCGGQDGKLDSSSDGGSSPSSSSSSSSSSSESEYSY
ncbi:Homeodomain-like transcriptional regulator [Striga hermonthica]|uniref:Homeodomain-like transcriptional regulator n=1 Tax=Striga hermonthica TaxID=68872 RepID=A0A9N7MVY3_STRHE|nr:Homeodomain-like transcriptional regulator [Striga hermonthica]